MAGNILCRTQYPGVVSVVARGHPAWTWGYRVGEQGYSCYSSTRLQRHRRHLPRGYWGAAEFQKRFGYAPRYLPDAPGFVQREEMLFPRDFPAQLRQAGIRHLGMITGRVRPEVDSALVRIGEYSGERWW